MDLRRKTKKGRPRPRGNAAGRVQTELSAVADCAARAWRSWALGRL